MKGTKKKRIMDKGKKELKIAAVLLSTIHILPVNRKTIIRRWYRDENS